MNISTRKAGPLVVQCVGGTDGKGVRPRRLRVTRDDPPPMKRLALVLIAMSSLASSACKRNDDVKADGAQVHGPGALRVVYATESNDPKIGEATRAIVKRRAKAFGLDRTLVSGTGKEVVIELDAPDAQRFPELEESLAREGRLEFTLLDDTADVFGKIDLDAHALPRGASMQNELAPIGFDTAGVLQWHQSHYVRVVKQPTEAFARACKRLVDWTASLGLPSDERIVLGYETDPSTKEPLYDVVRTYAAHASVAVSDQQIADAAVHFPSEGDRPEPIVFVTLNDEGGETFRELTAANVKRRLVILLDGWVQVVPVIQGEIKFGVAGVMAAKPTELETTQLAAILRLHRLPAKLVLISMTQIPSPT